MVNKKSQSANAKFASKKAVKKTNANGKEDDPHKDFPRKFRHILQLKQAAAAVGEVREGGGAAAAAAAVKPSSKTNKDKNHKNHHQQVKQSSKFSFAKNGKQVAHLQTGQQKRQQLHGASTSTTTSKKSSKSSSSPSSHHNSNLTSHHTDDNVRVYEKIPFGVVKRMERILQMGYVLTISHSPLTLISKHRNHPNSPPVLKHAKNISLKKPT